MGRLIDADALMDALDSLCDTVCQYSKVQRSVMCGSCPLGGACDVVDNAPTVDAEPVIRCKDCRFYNTHDHRCVRMNHGFKDDFFCSWGERKDE